MALRNDNVIIRRIPADLFQIHDPEFKARYAGHECVGRWADWSLRLEVPCEKSLASATKRDPRIYHLKGKRGDKLDIDKSSERNALQPFAHLKQQQLTDAAATQLIHYLTNAPHREVVKLN